jgi:hypothetical protein
VPTNRGRMPLLRVKLRVVIVKLLKKTLTLLNGTIITMIMVIMSCLISTMTVFMGGGQQGTDLHSLMLIQLASIPIAVVAILGSVFLCSSGDQNANNIKRLYAAVPQWMVFGFLLLNSLVLAGEVALLIVSRATEQIVERTSHAPLMSMLMCSLAVCVLYARTGLLSGRPLPLSGRWPPQS